MEQTADSVHESQQGNPTVSEHRVGASGCF